MMIQSILTELLQCKVHKNVDARTFSGTLRGAITLPGCDRSQWFFEHFLSTFHALLEGVNLFLIELLQFLPNLSHMVLHGWSLLAPHFDDLNFGSYQKLACPKLIF